MTLSGRKVWNQSELNWTVLIPLLVDDPLWATKSTKDANIKFLVLIPLLVDDPLWDKMIGWKICKKSVLIPLLVDDPLWDKIMLLLRQES